MTGSDKVTDARGMTSPSVMLLTLLKRGMKLKRPQPFLCSARLLVQFMEKAKFERP
ncbi:hypothetical protein IC006_0959 [Sulfuracidifex tepidarius]|uniref:Uncharacterized protein n=1 Tax=Sulfuracidifex tepidarius TaxID=1294262 RepID=A0A510DTZ3_9CREN|nr:hypothetical protein IC006_0959 [Sulfuracidifex tepidarius]BBG26420.1 hypothetical protein IC007_0928 [Sulfuracidifex tepidarius]